MVTKNSAAFVAASNVTVAKVKTNAKNKAPTKADKARTNLAKANKSAAKGLDTGKDFDTMALDLVNASKRNDGAARTLAFYLNHEFAEPMKAFRCHWTAFTSANCRTDNEKAILARVNGYRDKMKALAEAKGLVNVNKPWSDTRKVSAEVYRGGGKVERIAKPLEQVQRADLLHAYKAGMKEERQTDAERDLNIIIGELLMKYFKEDITKY